MTTVSLLAAFFALAGHAAAQDRLPVTDDAVPSWNVTYGDGRTVLHLIRASSWLWTPEFPRISDSNTSQNGHPLKALAFSYVADGQDLKRTGILGGQLM
jgi:hypothetical protein